MLQRLSLRLALWMVLVTIVMQFMHAFYRLSIDIPLAKQAGLQEINKVINSLKPALSEGLYQFNDRVSAQMLKTFESYSSVHAAWLVDDENNVVQDWVRAGYKKEQLKQEHTWPLLYRGNNIGALHMNLDFTAVTNLAKDKIWNLIWLSIAMGFINLLLLYWVAQYLVANPIIQLSSVVANLDTDKLHQKDFLALENINVNAELDVLKTSIKSILTKLSSNLSSKKHTMDMLQKFNEGLEARVSMRTFELEKAKEKAEIASRSKTDLLNNMTHELRTPLNSIMGFSSILQGRELPPENEKLVSNIHESGIQLLTLINDIIDFVDMDGKPLSVQTFSLYDVISSSQYAMAELAKQKDINLNIEINEKAIMNGDPKRLGIVLRHLLSNAIKFTEVGEVSLSCEVLENKRIKICVCDTGEGIDLNKIEEFNQSLVQADQGLNRRKSGVGLGLSIVGRVCKKWGGDLTFSHVQPHGTQVTIELPDLS